MNIVQQVAASLGTALFSVLLTNGILDLDPANPATYIPGLADAFADGLHGRHDPGRLRADPGVRSCPAGRIEHTTDPALLVGH